MTGAALWKDLAYAARALRNSPVFAATAVVTIGLGMGASTAIFSVTKAVLLRKLLYQNPDRIVAAIRDDSKRGLRDFPLTTPDFLDLRNGSKDFFEDLDAIETSTANFVVPGADGAPEHVTGASVTTGFLRLLGAKIAVGRNFEDADGAWITSSTTGARVPTAAILSYEYWQRRYGGDRSIAGKPILNGSVIVAGVLEPGFELLFPPELGLERTPDFWFVERIRYNEPDRLNAHLRLLGKLKPGVSLEQAQAGADVVSALLRRTITMRGASGFAFRLEPMGRHLVAEARPAILALSGAAIFLLLIACANVANLLLVRTSLREREFGVRAALGGSRWRLASQLLMEALLLSSLGAGLGAGLAWAGVHSLVSIAPAGVPRLDAVKIDWMVLGFSAVVALTAAAAFGVPAALQASRPNIMRILRASSRTSGLGAGSRLRDAAVVAEVALSFVLLIGSGLMFRSFVALRNVDPGFDARHVLTFRLAGGVSGSPAVFLRQLQERLRAIPGVQDATAARVLPLDGVFYGIRWGRPEQGDPMGLPTSADFQVTLPGYFETLGARLLEGRSFTEQDNDPSRKLVIIDDLMARKAFPGESAVGKHLLFTSWDGPVPVLTEVIGVVAHQRENSLAEPGHEQIYFTNGYVGHWMLLEWAVRTTGDPSKYAAAVRAEVGKMGRGVVIAEMQPMQAIEDRARASTRFALLLISSFAAIAAALAGVGLYGVLSTVVRRRTAEIGVRMALGAGPASILKLVIGYGIELSITGIGIGIVAAVVLTHWMGSMLVGVRATDPVTFVAMAALFLIIGVAASWLPARRASALDPTVALRED
jgi:putative ABC transport system permease protein